MKIDRIELADIGNPVLLAQAVLKQLPELKPPFPVDAIARAAGIIEIKPLTSSGFEGGLITTDEKRDGCILFNGNSPPGRQRFTIGHELGHFLNPWHKPGQQGQILCRAKDMVARKPKSDGWQQKMEAEANEFSSELLMPATCMREDIKRLRAPEIDHLTALSKKYDVSREMAGRRYVDFQNEPCAIVFSKNGVVSYAYLSKDFPRINVWTDDLVPAGTRTKIFHGESDSSSEWEEHPADVWLSGNQYEAVFEQTLIQSNGYRITLLTLGDEKEEEIDRHWSRRNR